MKAKNFLTLTPKIHFLEFNVLCPTTSKYLKHLLSMCEMFLSFEYYIIHMHFYVLSKKMLEELITQSLIDCLNIL